MMFDKILEQIKMHRDTVAAIWMKGESAARSITGTHMLFSDAGCIYGSFDNEIVRKGAEVCAMQLFEGYQGGVRHFTYVLNGDPQIVDTEFYFVYIRADDRKQRRMVERAVQLLHAGERSWIAVNTKTMELSVIDTFGVSCGGELPDEICRYFPEAPVNRIVGGVKYYIEAVDHAQRVYIFGGGDISIALAGLLRPTGFCCVVLDEDMDHANRERFPDVYDVRTVDYRRMERLFIEEMDMAVVLSRDFQQDERIEGYLLSTPVRRIIGVGDLLKRQYEERWLIDQGYKKEQFSKIRMIEVEDGAGWTPYEIAVQIAAELIRESALRKDKRYERDRTEAVAGT